jgi:GT2 family glycosyltransferase
MQLSVIIVNYNVKYFLEQCLCSVQKACNNIESEILVVDNNSADGSRALLEPLFPSVTFIWNDSNEGFAKANNRALQQATGNHILFLNPDTILPEDAIEKCIAFLLAHSSAGALGVRMIDGSGNFLKESKRAFPSPLTSLYKLTGLAALFPRSKIFAKYYLGYLNEKEDQEVDVLAGAFMMIPRAVLTATGSFDEQFFMYGEDVDLSYRIQKAGFVNFYFAGTTIIHFKGESTKKGSLNYVRLFYKAMSLFVKKHYSNGRAGLFVFFIQVAIWFRAVIAAIGGFFQRAGGKKKTNRKTVEAVETIIVSGEKDLSFIMKLLQRPGAPERVLGRVNTDKILTGDVLGAMQELPGLIKKHTIKEIIFCANGFSYKEIISIIQQLPGVASNKFHASGSSSIVGSDNKDAGGDHIASH